MAWRPWPFTKARDVELDRNVEVGTAAALAAMDVALAQLRAALTAVEKDVVFDDPTDQQRRHE